MNVSSSNSSTDSAMSLKRVTIIVYGNHAGRCAKTAIGKVINIYSVPSNRGYLAPAGERHTRMRVCSIQDDTGYRKDRAYAKNVNLLELERVIKYPKQFVSNKIAEALEIGEDRYRCQCYHKPATDEDHRPWCKYPDRPTK